MSLMGTLAKVAIGIAVAKGAGSLLRNRGGKVGDDGLFGGAHSPGASQGGTGLEDIMGDLLGGKSSSGGGLGGVLEDLQRQNPRTQDGGLDDLLGGALGGGGGSAGQGNDILGTLVKGLTEGQAGGGGLGGLLGGLAGAVAGGKQQRKGDFGSMLNDAMQRRGEPPAPPTPEQDVVAALMLRAMIQAAKSDGKLDDAERDKLLKNLGEVSAEERAFVQQEMARPVDPKALARQVPPGLEQQVYVMSLLGIDLDNRNEAQYLHGLATEMGIDQATSNAIHAKMGVPSLYG